MTDFTIPKGKDFSFTVKVIEHDSFLAQDLTYMDSATMTVFNKDDFCEVFSQELSILAGQELNGVLEATIPSTKTDLLEVSRGPKEDGYYLKSEYQATISVTFTDGTLPINVLIEDIYVSPIGVVCQA